MKKLIYLSLVLVLCSQGILAQAPEKFNYQAVIRNSSGELVTDQDVGIKVSILDETSSGSVLYSEEHAVSTNAYGQVALEIGNGTLDSGDFSTIDWGVNDKFLKLEVDIEGGTSYIPIGTSQMLSVPYALYANVATTAELLGTEGVYSTSSDTLFVVKDHSGNVVFAVFPDGAQVIVNESTKGKVGGFAVSGRSPSKADDIDILKVTVDSTRIYVSDSVGVKGKVGGFAVSGRSPSKGLAEDYLMITPDSTRIYVNQSAKGKVGGFAVSGRSPGKSSTIQFLNLTPDNYFIGHQTGGEITTGAHNIMLGYESGFSNKTGSYNTFLGYQSGYINNASFNSFIGYLSGRANSNGEYNTFIGYESGTSNLGGDNNVFLGHQTGHDNTNGHENVFIGYRSGFSNSFGYDNIFIGNLAGENASGNTHSTFIGNEAGKNMTGDDNICIGDRAGTDDYVTSYESFGTVILGIDAGRNINGQYNTVLGYAAGSSWGGESTGNYNTFVGRKAGSGAFSSRLGSNNVCLGNDAGYGKTGDNKLYIANNSTTTLIYGDFAAEEVYIDGTLYATTYGPSDTKLKTNLTEIKSGLKLLTKLSGYYFNWNDLAKKEFNYSDDEQVGVIAQDVEKIFPQLVVTNSKGYKAVDYSKFSPIIIEAIKEQQSQIEDLKSENEVLKRKLNEIIEMLDK